MNRIKFCADINKTSLPFVHVTEGTFKGFCFLVDSGSDTNILFKPMYQRVKDKIILTNEHCTLSGIEGKKSVVMKMRANISFFGVEHETLFYLADSNVTVDSMSERLGAPMAGIIGIEFMRDHRWVIDFVAQEITIRPHLILDCA